jgi:hypothetical protein
MSNYRPGTRIVQEIIGMDITMAEVGQQYRTNMAVDLDDVVNSTVYRVSIREGHEGQVASVICLDIEMVDDQYEAVYDSLEDLPQWIQDRLAVLSMLSYDPPTEIVSGIGRRISKDTFWVYKPDS